MLFLSKGEYFLILHYKMFEQLRYTWTIWAGLIICLYIVFACEFEYLRFIKLPYSESLIIRLNDIAKNFSLSYIAGVIFYLLSEMIPYIRKRRFVLEKLNIEIDNIEQVINNFYRYFCGCADNQNITDKIEDIFYSTTEQEYEDGGTYSIPTAKMLELRKLLTAVDDAVELFLANDVYIGENNFKIALNIKTKECMSILRGLVQAQTVSEIEYNQLFELLKGITSIRQEINRISLRA